MCTLRNSPASKLVRLKSSPSLCRKTPPKLVVSDIDKKIIFFPSVRGKTRHLLTYSQKNKAHQGHDINTSHGFEYKYWPNEDIVQKKLL